MEGNILAGAGEIMGGIAKMIPSFSFFQTIFQNVRERTNLDEWINEMATTIWEALNQMFENLVGWFREKMLDPLVAAGERGGEAVMNVLGDIGRRLGIGRRGEEEEDMVSGMDMDRATRQAATEQATQNALKKGERRRREGEAQPVLVTNQEQVTNNQQNIQAPGDSSNIIYEGAL
jgi:hypothetical protein